MAGPGLPILHFWVWAWPSPFFCFCIQPGPPLFFWPGLAFLPPRRGLETPTLPSFTLESGFFSLGLALPFPFLAGPGLLHPFLCWAWSSCFFPFALGLALPFPLARPGLPPCKTGPGLPILPLRRGHPFLFWFRPGNSKFAFLYSWVWPDPPSLSGRASPLPLSFPIWFGPSPHLSFFGRVWPSPSFPFASGPGPSPFLLAGPGLPPCKTGPGLPILPLRRGHPFLFRIRPGNSNFAFLYSWVWPDPPSLSGRASPPLSFPIWFGLGPPLSFWLGLAFPSFPSGSGPGLFLCISWAWPSPPALFDWAWPSLCFCIQPGPPLFFWPGLAFLPPRRGLGTPTLPSFTLELGFFHWAWPSPFLFWPGLAFSILSFAGPGLPVSFPLHWAWPFPFLLARPGLPPCKTGPGLPILPLRRGHPFLFWFRPGNSNFAFLYSWVWPDPPSLSGRASPLPLSFPIWFGLGPPLFFWLGLAFPSFPFASGPGLLLSLFWAWPSPPALFGSAWTSFLQGGTWKLQFCLSLLLGRAWLPFPLWPGLTSPSSPFLAQGLAFPILFFGGLPLLPFWPGPGLLLPFLLGCAESPSSFVGVVLIVQLASKMKKLKKKTTKKEEKQKKEKHKEKEGPKGYP